MFESILASSWYTYLILPILIFCGRIVDVSIGTVRVIFTTRGLKKVAPFLSFFEVLVWLIVIEQIFSTTSGPIAYIAYAGGFATGTYIGIRIEEKLSFGKVMIRIITGKDSYLLIKKLEEEKIRFTLAPAKGSKGDVSIILSIVDRKESKKIVNLIKEFNKEAFYTIEDLRFVNESSLLQAKKSFLNSLTGITKGK